MTTLEYTLSVMSNHVLQEIYICVFHDLEKKLGKGDLKVIDREHIKHLNVELDVIEAIVEEAQKRKEQS